MLLKMEPNEDEQATEWMAVNMVWRAPLVFLQTTTRSWEMADGKGSKTGA